MTTSSLHRGLWASLGIAGAALAVGLGACGDTAGSAATPDTIDASTGASDGGVQGDGAAGSGDSSTPDAIADAGPFVPASARAELVFSSPARTKTPPAWNAHSPKLVGDGTFFYAVHTYFTDPVDTRFAAILRRSAGAAIGSGTWSEVARVQTPHQPPGIVMDTAKQMHMVFDCLRPDTVDVTCFPGGAGTGGLTSHFYHLVFAARDVAGALRFDTYGNANEWSAESNGYTGIGTTSDGLTYWSLASTAWQRVVAWSSAGGSGTAATLDTPGEYLLYPIHAASPLLGSKELVLYAGNFDPTGGNNASYLASTAYAGDRNGLTQLFRRAPAVAMPGAIGAFPSDIAFAADGTLYALSYLAGTTGHCTELLRFDGGIGTPPTILPVGCVSDYAKLQLSRSGVLYLVTGGASGANVKLGISADRGASWTWQTIPIAGLPANGDVSYDGFTPVKPYTSPTIFDPDRFVFFFYGADATGGVANSYVGEIDLAAAQGH